MAPGGAKPTHLRNTKMLLTHLLLLLLRELELRGVGGEVKVLHLTLQLLELVW